VERINRAQRRCAAAVVLDLAVESVCVWEGS